MEMVGEIVEILMPPKSLIKNKDKSKTGPALNNY